MARPTDEQRAEAVRLDRWINSTDAAIIARSLEKLQKRHGFDGSGACKLRE